MKNSIKLAVEFVMLQSFEKVNLRFLNVCVSMNLLLNREKILKFRVTAIGLQPQPFNSETNT